MELNEIYETIGKIVIYGGSFVLSIMFINWVNEQFKPSMISRQNIKGERFYVPNLFIVNNGIPQSRLEWLMEKHQNWLFKVGDKYTEEEIRYINTTWNSNCSC